MTKGHRHFEEHVRNREVEPPSLLYKYVTVDTARNILKTGKLRFQSPLCYNDPLDCQWNTLWPIFTPEARTYERALFERALRDPASWPDDAAPKSRNSMDRERARIEALPDDQREDAIDRVLDELTNAATIAAPVAEQIDDTRRRMRILCLCECDRSILMWSHYADQHRGVLLGFDVSAMENGLQRPFEQVAYCDAPPRLVDPEAWSSWFVYGSRLPEMQIGRDWALTKHTGWAYEKEWRLVCVAERGTLGEYEDCKFPADALVEISSGCRTEDAYTTELLKLARAIRPEVQHYKMSVHRSRFELVKTQADST